MCAGVKPYACSMCDRRFFQRYHLARHTLKHTGTRLLTYPSHLTPPSGGRETIPFFFIQTWPTLWGYLATGGMSVQCVQRLMSPTEHLVKLHATTRECHLGGISCPHPLLWLPGSGSTATLVFVSLSLFVCVCVICGEVVVVNTQKRVPVQSKKHK